MRFSFPNWPAQRLLREVIAAYNARNALQKQDLESIEWSHLYALTLAFLRHAQTQYDALLTAGIATREQLHAEINGAALRHYPWLRLDKDPRYQLLLRNSTPDSKSFRIYNAISRELCRLTGQRAQLLMARSRHLGTARKELDHQLGKVDSEISRLSEFFKPGFELPPEHKDLRVLTLGHDGGYCFGGRTFPHNYIRPTSFSCEGGCSSRVWRTKVPIDLGAGIKLVSFSCECISLSVTGRYAGGVNARLWRGLLTGEIPSDPTTKQP
jgi:hypothetical protein